MSAAASLVGLGASRNSTYTTQNVGLRYANPTKLEMGSTGNNTLYSGAGNDSLYGGDEKNDQSYYSDTVSYANFVSPITVNLSLTSNQATGACGTDQLFGIENVIGSSAGDTLIGNSAANQIDGGGGVDTITGGRGADTLIGGGAADRFVFKSSTNSSTNVTTFDSTGTAKDIISDFSSSQADIIDLSGIDAINSSSNNIDQAFSFINQASFSAAGQLRYAVVGENTILYGNTDVNSGTAEFELQLNGVMTLNASDFNL